MLEIEENDKQTDNLELLTPSDEKTSNIREFIDVIEERIKLMGVILVVDRFENNYAVCENRETGEKVYIENSKLPSDIKEGTVLKYENGQYIIDKNIQEEIANRIKEKMKNLWVD